MNCPDDSSDGDSCESRKSGQIRFLGSIEHGTVARALYVIEVAFVAFAAWMGK